MSASVTSRLALPFIDAGQAAKELTHNEALARLDLAVQASASGIADDPPASPVEGETWIVGAAPTGVWSQRPGHLAGWTAAGWRFVAPVEGMSVWMTGAGVAATYRAGIWVTGELRGSRVVVGGLTVVGERGVAIGDPTGGTVVDAEARAGIGAILAALRHHGLIAS